MLTSCKLSIWYSRTVPIGRCSVSLCSLAMTCLVTYFNWMLLREILKVMNLVVAA